MREESKTKDVKFTDGDEYARARTKGRFYETLHASSATHFSRDQQWLRKANPEFVMVTNARNNKDHTKIANAKVSKLN